MDGKVRYNYVFNPVSGEWQPQSYYATGAATDGETISLSKSVLTDIQSLTTVSANEFLASDAVDVTPYQSITVFIDHALLGETQPGAGTEYAIEASSKASGNDAWRPLAAFRTASIAADEAIVSESNYPAQTVIEINPTPAYTLTDVIFFFNQDDYTKSEWARLKGLTVNTSFALQDGLTNTQASSVVYNRSEQFVASLDLTSIARVRVTCHNNLHGTAEDIMWQVRATAGEYW